MINKPIKKTENNNIENGSVFSSEKNELIQDRMQKC